MLFSIFCRIVPLSFMLFSIVSVSSGVKKSKLKHQHVDAVKAQQKVSSRKTGLLHSASLKMENLYFDNGIFPAIDQGIVKESPFPPVVKQCKLYSHFATRALFDVVRFSEDLACNLADLKSQTRGIAKEDRDLFLMHEVEDLAQSHIFYVLADVRDSEHARLTDVNSAWRMFLKLDDGSQVVPTKIVEIDFDAETRKLFGPNWTEISALKNPYRVEFPCDINTKKLGCRLIFSAPDLEGSLIWSAETA